MSEETRCPCGRRLHYRSAKARKSIEGLVDELGELVTVRVPGLGAWRVPRHYIALHGLRAGALPELAERHGWEAV